MRVRCDQHGNLSGSVEGSNARDRGHVPAFGGSRDRRGVGQRAEHVEVGSDDGHVGLFGRARKLEHAGLALVAHVGRVGVRLLENRREELGRNAVGLGEVDFDGPIGRLDVARRRLVSWCDDDRFDPEPAAGAGDAGRGFATPQDENLFEHRREHSSAGRSGIPVGLDPVAGGGHHLRMPVWLQTRGLEVRPVRREQLIWRAEAMLDALELGDSELSILLCSDSVIHELNRDYRGKDKPTDVLAFAMWEGESPSPDRTLLGDVVISVPTAARQARERDRPIVAEVTFLLAHGLLHLVGYDHQTRREEQEMNRETERLLAAVDAAR